MQDPERVRDGSAVSSPHSRIPVPDSRRSNSVPNRISLVGHTDTRPYLGRPGYSNWELSTERANAARRALEAGGLASDKTLRVVGLASLAPFDKSDPDNPINRRISIVVMTKAAEASAIEQVSAQSVDPD